MTIPLSVDTPSHILLQTQVTDHNSDPHPRRYLPFPSSPVTSTSENNIHVSESFNSNDDSSSKLTSSDKLSELPVPLTTTSPNRGIRSQNARAARRSLDSLPSFPTSDFAPLGHSPRLNQAWGTIPASKSLPLASNSDISLGTDTPKHRVSFDSDRVSIKQAFSRVNKGSDLPDSPSQSRSRAASPLRIFQHLSAGIHRRTHDPFVPVNPFVLSRSGLFSFLWRAHMNTDEEAQPEIAVFPGTMKAFVTDTLLRQIYLHMLLRLPSLYFSRVARIFEDAEVSRPDIERMIEAGMGGDAFPPSASAAADLYPPITSSLRESLAAASTPAVDRIPLPLPEDWTPALVSPALVRFKNSWEDFIGSLIKEWKTLNVVSALLLSAILTMFQIPPAASDPLTRTTALLSLVSALMSLCYGCVYIVRFSTMRSMYRASKFAEEARKTNTLIWWNVWTLLAMPAVFMAWSMVFFILSIVSFVWRTGSVLDPNERQSLGRHAVLGPRIAITVVLLLGLVYFALIIATLKRYGRPPSVRQAGGEDVVRGRTSSRRIADAQSRGDAADPRDRDVSEKGIDVEEILPV